LKELVIEAIDWNLVRKERRIYRGVEQLRLFLVNWGLILEQPLRDWRRTLR
jgi:ubiquinone biosynthesis protein Coq4